MVSYVGNVFASVYARSVLILVVVEDGLVHQLKELNKIRKKS